MTTVGSFEAKTHLPELLERVSRGETILITRRGKPAAKLVPADINDAPDVKEVLRKMKELRKGNLLGGKITVRDLVREGRRY